MTPAEFMAVPNRCHLGPQHPSRNKERLLRHQTADIFLSSVVGLRANTAACPTSTFGRQGHRQQKVKSC